MARSYEDVLPLAKQALLYMRSAPRDKNNKVKDKTCAAACAALLRAWRKKDAAEMDRQAKIIRSKADWEPGDKLR